MSTESVLKSLIDTLDHKIIQEREQASEHNARIDALTEARNEILNAHQAEINRAKNGPAPADVHHSLPPIHHDSLLQRN